MVNIAVVEAVLFRKTYFLKTLDKVVAVCHLLDMDGSVPFYEPGTVVARYAKSWKVQRALFLEATDPIDAPVLVIDLVDPDHP